MSSFLCVSFCMSGPFSGTDFFYFSSEPSGWSVLTEAAADGDRQRELGDTAPWDVTSWLGTWNAEFPDSQWDGAWEC